MAERLSFIAEKEARHALFVVNEVASDINGASWLPSSNALLINKVNLGT